MASTGEVACFGADKHEAFLKRLVKRDFRYTAAAAAAAAAAAD
jgi:hypothetical protein